MELRGVWLLGVGVKSGSVGQLSSAELSTFLCSEIGPYCWRNVVSYLWTMNNEALRHRFERLYANNGHRYLSGSSCSTSLQISDFPNEQGKQSIRIPNGALRIREQTNSVSRSVCCVIHTYHPTTFESIE
jgi:hypothetical protein